MATYFSHPYLFSAIIPSLKQTTPEEDCYHPFQIERKDIPPSQFHFSTINQPFNSGYAINFFKNLQVEVVSDNKEKPGLSEICFSDAKSTYALFNHIKEGKTPLKFQGDATFNDQCLDLIRQLLARPSGRYLIHSVCQNKTPVLLIPGNRNYQDVDKTCSNIRVFLDFKISSVFEVQIDQNGKRVYGNISFLSVFAHELIHTLQEEHIINKKKEYAQGILTKEIIRENKAIQKFRIDLLHQVHYTNLIEKLTIAGIKGQNLICEQMIRFEFGIPRRYGHKTPIFRPISENNPNDNPNMLSRSGKTDRIYNAAYLGIESEVKKLLSLGADAQSALLGAAQGGNLELLKDLIKNHRANVHSSSVTCQSQNKAVHMAAKFNHLAIIEYLVKCGADLSSSNKNGCMPIHFACDSKSSESIKYLVKKGVLLNELTHKGIAPLDLLVDKGGSKKSLEALLDAGAKLTQDFFGIFSVCASKALKSNQNFTFVKSYFDQKGAAPFIERQIRRSKRKRKG